jgi:DNA-binding MurR/RpiR family transcriptional regulator
MIPAIEAGRAGMSPANQRIADVVLARPQEAVRSSLSALARAPAVSEPTVLRFCRLVGATSFPDFKLALMRDLANPDAASRSPAPARRSPPWPPSSCPWTWRRRARSTRR